VNIWTILGLAPTADTREIKRAYARKLKVTRPEDDPAAFQALNEAYQTALRMAQFVVVEEDEEEPAPEPQPEPEPEQHALAAAEAEPAPAPAWERPLPPLREDEEETAEESWERPVAALREEAWERPVAAFRAPVDQAALEEQRRREREQAREQARAQAEAASQAAFEQAQRLWGEFLANSHVAPRWQLTQLFDSSELFNLEVREHFELFALQYCAGEDCRDDVREEIVAAYRWEEDDSFIGRRLPQAAGEALARLRAGRSHQQFRFETGTDPAIAALLADTPGRRFGSTLSRGFTRRMQEQIALIRGYHREMLHFKLNAEVFQEWERRVEGRRYFVETALVSAAVGLLPFMWAVVFGGHASGDAFALMVLAGGMLLAFGTGAAWAHYQPLARMTGSSWHAWLLHDLRYRPRWQFGWIALYAAFSTLMFIPDPPAPLVWLVTAAMTGAAMWGAFANSVMFEGTTFLIAGVVGVVLGTLLFQRPFESYGYLACATGVFAGMLLHYRGGGDLWHLLGKGAALLVRLRYAWLAGAAGLLLSADATPLHDHLHAAITWLWLLAGILLSRPTVHHAAALLGGFLGWGLLAATFTKSSVLNRSPMMTIAMAMIAVAIYMLVNMSRANKNQHQFS
jgi:hypothetical protein